MSITKLYRRDNQPFAQIPNELIRDPEITQGAFRLIVYLMSHADGYDLTYDQIEAQIGLGRYAINQGILNLTAKGWLVVERPKASNGQFGAKSWTVLNPFTATTVGNSTVESPHMGKSTDIRRTIIKEDKELRTINPQPAVEESFQIFWSIYPLRKEKQDALKAFAKAVALVGVEVILEGARRYRDDPNRTASFTKYPATWLNKGCWDDDPLPPRVLTSEEKEASARDEAARKREREQRASDELKAQMREAEERARANPPRKCEHDRIAVMCDKCNRLKPQS